ncbi:DUF5060 domain-containing protein, partial [Eudoraea sp.]
MPQNLFLSLLFLLFGTSIYGQTSTLTTEQWSTLEITLIAQKSYTNPYKDVAVSAEFSNEKGDTIKRPAFWDGENIWKIRFTSPDNNSTWKWISTSSDIS